VSFLRVLGSYRGSVSPQRLWQAEGPQHARSLEDESEKMNVTIRKLEHSDHEYLAYAKSLCGKATYFFYFCDDIWGAVVLCNFVQMLKSYFQAERLKLTIHENAVCLKNEQILALVNEEP
jgi:hypothetical protein